MYIMYNIYNINILRIHYYELPNYLPPPSTTSWSRASWPAAILAMQNYQGEIATIQQKMEWIWWGDSGSGRSLVIQVILQCFCCSSSDDDIFFQLVVAAPQISFPLCIMDRARRRKSFDVQGDVIEITMLTDLNRKNEY